MTSVRVTQKQPTSVGPFDVLGLDFREVLCHAMLCDERTVRTGVTPRTKLEVTHMCPPIRAEAARCDVVGKIKLSDGEIRKIKRFVSRFRTEMTANAKLSELSQSSTLELERSQYLIFPEKLPPSRNCSHWSFSCVGYVLSAYESIGIKLLDSNRPLKTLDQLRQIYPQVAQLADPNIRSKYILVEGESWPVALVGYLFNSLSRIDAEIRETPFQPCVGDEHFPSKRSVDEVAPV